MRYWITCVLLASLAPCCWAASGSWVPGLAGLKNGSVPGPGYYFINTSFAYSSDEFRDKHGKSVNQVLGEPVDFKVDVVANMTGFTWISPYKVLGASYGANIWGTVGYVKGDLSLGEIFNASSSETGLMDTYVEPINLSWHLKHFDVFTSYGFFAPTGKFDENDTANTGRDRWTHILNAGMTAYFDEKKSWTAATTFRYEIHMGQQHQDARFGDNLTLEWGIGKQIVFMNEEKTAPAGILNFGPVGYAQWQTTHNTGSDAIQKDVLAKVYGAGFEANYTRVNWKGATFGLRFNKEFEAHGRPQGMTGTFNIGIKF